MASNSASVRCGTHDVPCRIYTNRYGCSDYVCGLQDGRCDFRKPVKKVAPRSCPIHPEFTVVYELFSGNAPSKIQLYYRCNRPRDEANHWWCGYERRMEAKPPSVNLKQVTACIQDNKGAHNNTNSMVLQQDLERTKAIIANANLSCLPDRGMKLIAKVTELEYALSKLAIEPSCDVVRPITINPPVAQRTPADIPAVWPTTLSTFYDDRQTTDSCRELLNLALERLHSSMTTKPMATEETADPQHLTVPLVPHQRTALSWLLWRETQLPSGGILADDMGLGKTLTMISLILKTRQLKAAKVGMKKSEDAECQAKKDEMKCESAECKTKKDTEKSEGAECKTKNHKEKSESGECKAEKDDEKLVPSSVTLIVCPATLMDHWKQEVALRCAPARLNIHVFHGSGRKNLTISRLLECDIVITTYETMRSELTSSKSPKSSSLLLRVKFERIIFDEGHVIRTPKSNTSVSACTLNASSRWILTGTPIHNELSDMYSLLRFLRCTPFDDFKVWKNWVDNGTQQGRERLAIIVSCILLRRTKSDLGFDGQPLVILPKKTVHNLRLRLREEEFEVYQMIFDRSKAMLEAYLKTKTGEDVTARTAVRNLHSKTGPQLVNKGGCSDVGQRGMLQMLVQLLRLRQCCCHLSLLSEALEVKGGVAAVNEDDVDPFDGLTAQMNDLNLEEDPLKDILVDAKSGKLGVAFQRSHRSSKIGALLDKLKVLREQSARVKSVVVSQWTSMLDIVALHLQEAGISFCQITGKVSIKDRSLAVKNFNDTLTDCPSVLLLSLKAGGVGLNLVGGSHLFFLDLHWNPALESQAADRVHRMGQTKDVHIYRFVCEETIETKIATLQKLKLTLAEGIVQGNSVATKSKLSLEDLKQLFGVR